VQVNGQRNILRFDFFHKKKVSTGVKVGNIVKNFFARKPSVYAAVNRNLRMGRTPH